MLYAKRWYASPGPGGRCCTGFIKGAIVWGPVILIEFNVRYERRVYCRISCGLTWRFRSSVSFSHLETNSDPVHEWCPHLQVSTTPDLGNTVNRKKSALVPIWACSAGAGRLTRGLRGQIQAATETVLEPLHISSESMPSAEKVKIVVSYDIFSSYY